MKNVDLIKVTSTDTASPFAQTSVTGYDNFDDHYVQDEEFIASFADASDNYMVAECYLDGSNEIVVSRVLKSSDEKYGEDVPTFSGTTTITIGASSYNSFGAYTGRFGEDEFTDACPSLSLINPTINQNSAAGYFYLHGYDLGYTGWFYGLYAIERALVAGNYRLGIYFLNRGKPGKVACQTASVAHGNSGTNTVVSAFDNALTITNVSQANPGVLTYTGTDPANDTRVYITDVVGMTEVNEKSYLIKNVNTTANTFELYNLDGTAEDTSGYTAYTSGGTLHFPVFLTQGRYMTGMATDAALGWRGVGVSQQVNNIWIRTGANGHSCGYRQVKTYAALADDPTGGAWFNNISNHIVGLNMCKA